MSTLPLFKGIENKHDVYRGKDCIKKFCESLKEQSMEIINLKKKKIKLLTPEQQESHENQNVYRICQGKNGNKYLKNKKYRKVRQIIVIMQGNIQMLHIAYSIAFLNESSYDYHFIIR